MKFTIGREFTPSTVLKKKVVEVKKIIITAGGGMGGSLWQIYTKDALDLNQKIITINSSLSEKHIINTNFIVQVYPVKIAHLQLLNTGNMGIGEGPGTIMNYYYEYDINDEVVFKDNYNSNEKKLNNIINEEFI